MKIDNCSLVLEGGSMRASFSAGIIQGLLEKELEFQTIVAVSAGAAVAANYVSNQSDRNIEAFVTDVNNKKRGGLMSFLLGKGFYNTDYMYQRAPYQSNLFDYETFFNSSQEILIGATDIQTADMVYFRKSEFISQVDSNKKFQASASVPFITKPVTIDGKHYVDGGVVESIPIEQAIRSGFTKHVIIMTQPKDYIKKPRFYSKRLLQKYPKLGEQLNQRHLFYKKQQEIIHELEKNNQAFVFYPEKRIVVRSTERDEEKLMLLYSHGYKQFNDRYEALLEFLNQS